MIEALKQKIETAIPGVSFKLVRGTLLLENPEHLLKVASYLRNQEGWDYLSSLTGADYLTYLEVIYHFYSMQNKTGPVVLRVRVKRDQPVLPSIVSVYRSAEFQERETYDMFGVTFAEHPDLRRIFMWDNFAGFPLRKDYQQEDSETLEAEDVAWLEARHVQVPDEMKARAAELKQQGKRAVAEKRNEA